MSTFRKDISTGTIVGYLGGFLLAGFEGLHAVLTTHIGPSSQTMRSAEDIAAVVAAPVAAYPILGALGSLLLTIITYPLLKKFTRTLSEEDRISTIIGLITSIGLVGWGIFVTNPALTRAMLLNPARLVINIQMITLGIFAGFGVGLLIRYLLKRFSIRAIALTMAAVWPSVILSSLTLLWLKRNLFLSQGFIKTMFGYLGIVILLAASLIIVRFLLGRLYRPSGGLIRSLIIPVVILAASIVSVVYALTPRIPILTGGEENTGRKIILITIDTLRADRLGSYGYPRDTTPRADELAEDGVRFEIARTQSPWTLSSLASIITSTYPTVNAVLTGNNRLEEARTTIAEAMRDAGLLTQAIVSNGWLQHNFGLSQGFTGYHHSGEVFSWTRYGRMIWLRIAKGLFPDLFPLGQNYVAADLFDRAVDWINTYHDRDFFLWIHAIDPHDPYLTPKGYEGYFKDDDYKGRYMINSGMIYLLRYGTRLRPEDKEQLELLYDREIRYTDDHMGRLIDTLKERGIFDETLVVVSSDHGEEFWEHDGLMHGHTLYDDQLLVPLIMHHPNKLPKGKVIEEPVRLLDLVPTILDLYGIRIPEEVQGQSMLPLIYDQPDVWMPPPSYAEALLYFDELKYVYRDGYKLIHNTVSGRDILFDLRSDSLERWDLTRTRPDLYKDMRTDLDNWLTRSEEMAERIPHSAEGSKARIDPETEAQLRALGYLH